MSTDGDSTHPAGVIGRPVGALTGLLAAAVAIGVAHLVAGVLGPGSSPIVTVGDSVVDLTPAPVKEFAVSTFGTYDKPVLLAGIGLLVAVFGALVGVLSTTSRMVGPAAFGLFAAIGVVSVLTRPDARAVDVLPVLVGAATGTAALLVLLRAAARTRPPALIDRTEHAAVPVRPAPDRRRFLALAGGAAVVAGTGGGLGELLRRRFDVSAARAAVRLPEPASPARPVPAGADLRIPGLSRFVTPNRQFYRVDTALALPQVDPRDWTLRVHGMVDRPFELSFDDLLDRPLQERMVTLTCVSNQVGGRYVGNARWLGVDLAELLREAGIRRGADQILSRSDDGWTCGTPVAAVMDGRDALLAVGMNGEPLPVVHGFPARLVVPGLYGYVSATKWVVDLLVTTFAAEQAYWAKRDWAVKAPIKTMSRIDVPEPLAEIPAGSTRIAGVAWAQHRGIDAVEVSVDNGPWRQAELAPVPNIDTWRQWVHDWDATPGQHTIRARATDATGYTQTRHRVPPIPDGATGWQSVVVTVT